jgi:transposase
MSIVDANGTPLNAEVESASTHEGHVAEKTVDGIKKKKYSRCCRKAARLVPVRVISDKGYDDDGLRERFAVKGIDFIVPYRSNRVRRYYEDGRKLRRYCRRWKVERTNAWFKNFRRVAVRWDRNLTAYKGFVHLACICIALRRF